MIKCRVAAVLGITATGQLAVESPKRVPDRQMGQSSFVLAWHIRLFAYVSTITQACRKGWTLGRSLFDRAIHPFLEKGQGR